MFRNQNYRVLVIDENATLTVTIGAQLQAQGYTPIIANNVEAGLKLLCQESPDIILMSSHLSRQNSLDLCQHIRRDTAAPIVLFNGPDTEDDLLAAFEAGAEDYVPAPLSVKSLVARSQAILRRVMTYSMLGSITAPNYPPSEPESILQAGDVKLDLTSCRAEINDRHVTLTPNEFRLLAILMRVPGEVYTREELRRRVWPDDKHSLHLVEVHIANLRSKIEEDAHHPQYVVTVRSRGYKFAEV